METEKVKNLPPPPKIATSTLQKVIRRGCGTPVGREGASPRGSVKRSPPMGETVGGLFLTIGGLVWRGICRRRWGSRSMAGGYAALRRALVGHPSRGGASLCPGLCSYGLPALKFRTLSFAPRYSRSEKPKFRYAHLAFLSLIRIFAGVNLKITLWTGK